ncbi:hypothetical protein GCM10012275_56700 [Longimycelium tulufanense]|uniref:Methyltransferase type 12 domain-containing protein n=1 Tax=Longimycelium tulufanense TaxID=907463 RepID=A0A8J3CHM7_9PSEU|nr:methyltransferase [Longimycelium tulufanense]GGM78735.1 hypothetical protein GCM10012275_56700 [Longimycelium tulufanense]
MEEQLQQHYDRLADTYNETWGHRPAYLDWMADHIRRRLLPRPGGWMADIGAGTGLFLRRLLPFATEHTPLVCIDPSAAMLARLPRDPRLHPLQATAEDVAAGRVALPCPAFDTILIKEAVHHFADLDQTLTGLANRLAPDGRILVVATPVKLDYPLFRAAWERFAALQPEAETVAAALRRAGLTVTTTVEEFPVTIERERWLQLVANRWMSVLSTFSDEELERGLAEIAEQNPADPLEFTDRFVFTLGHRTS